MLRAGELRDRVAFEMRVPEPDGYGSTLGPFVEQLVVAARITARFGGEQVMAARLAGRQPVTITVRQSADTRRIDETWRARNARTETMYAIRSIADPDGRREWLDILCETGTAT